MPTDTPHIFIDTTDVHGNQKAWPELGAIAGPAFSKAVATIQAQLYVPDLVLEEVVHRRFRSLKKIDDELRELAKQANPHIKVQIGPFPPTGSREGCVAGIRQEVKAALASLGVEIVATKPVVLHEVLELSLKRVPPFTEDENPKGFHDAVILLAALKAARDKRLPECFFVSRDTRFNQSAISTLAKKHHTSCRLVQGCDQMADMLTDMHASKVEFLGSTRIQKAAEFMHRNLSKVQEYLDAHPFSLEDIKSVLLVAGDPIGINSVRVTRIDTAFPAGTPKEGSEISLTFYGEAIVELTLLPHSHPVFTSASTGENPPAGPMRGILSSSPYYGTFVFGTPIPLIPPTPVKIPAPLPISGTATAIYRHGSYVDEPIIKSVQPSGQKRKLFELT